MDLQGATVAVQGFGNVGSHAARILNENGCRIVALSDIGGAFFKPAGFAVQDAISYVDRYGSLEACEKALGATQLRDPMAVLEQKVDILVPAALEGQITAENAGRIQARIVAEGANGPTTPEADKILYERGVYLIPDILCNAGGVTVSYFEQVQNTYNFYWDVETVARELDKRLTRSFKDVHDIAQAEKVHNRLAAYMVAVKRVADAMKLRGWT
jgi:glutamate dehydrogenase/leucine dehydrogenase